MKLALRLLRLQPFDEEADPPRPEWINSWWFGGLLLSSALTGGLTALLLVVDRQFSFALASTAGTLFACAGVAEWCAGLKRRALNTMSVVCLWALAVAAFTS